MAACVLAHSSCDYRISVCRTGFDLHKIRHAALVIFLATGRVTSSCCFLDHVASAQPSHWNYDKGLAAHLIDGLLSVILHRLIEVVLYTHLTVVHQSLITDTGKRIGLTSVL